MTRDDLQPENQQKKDTRRDWLLFLILLLLAFGCLLITAQYAVSQERRSQVRADMLSELNPDTGRGFDQLLTVIPLRPEALTPIWDSGLILTPQGTPGVVPTVVFGATPTGTPGEVAAGTPTVATATSITPSPTGTTTPTGTPTGTPTPTSTPTATPTGTPTETPTGTPTGTPTPTSTPTSIPTDTPVPTAPPPPPTVPPAPVIYSITPDTQVNTAAVPVTILGANFQAGCTAALDGVSLSVTNCAPGTVQASVPVNIVAGFYDLSVTNPDARSGTLTGAYTATNPVPVLSAITPDTWYNTSDRAVTITGSNFRNTGAPGSLRARLNATGLLNVTFVNQNTLTAIVPCSSASMALGSYTLYVTNPGPTDPTGSLANAFTVIADTPPSAPTVLRAAPGDSEIVLGWDPPAPATPPDLAGYRVYRTDAGLLNPGSLVTDNRYHDPTVTNGTPYTYYVTAVDLGNNESASSNQASATPYGLTPYTHTTVVTCTGATVYGPCADAGGPADNVPVGIDGSAQVTLDFGLGYGIIDAPGYDLVFHEYILTPPGVEVLIDYITLDISRDGSTWYTIFEWDGDNPGDVSGTNIDAYAADAGGESEDEAIPVTALYPYPGSGIEIDIGAANPAIPPGYGWHLVRFRYPGTGTDVADIDAVRRLH